MHHILLAFLLLFTACASAPSPDSATPSTSPPVSASPTPSPMERVTLSSDQGTVELIVEIADEPVEQAQGLMERTELPQDHGMLFVFAEPQSLSFWMENTRIPLDVLFFDAEGKFLNVQTMDPCRKDPCPLYSSDAPAKYALEVKAGFAKDAGVGEGWKLERGR